ncbi:MAG: beta-N-acetylhexosaminidase [Verrucomicrobia bacterium]|nr:beta-N-acetylhexosaminidase [Verrucomicrobiota bacterium]MCH8514191.1 beta-N-acetylhexosaminidase [Kiritimatiellia bacterium]
MLNPSPPKFLPVPRKFEPLPGHVDTSAFQTLADLEKIAVPGDFRGSEAYRLELSDRRKRLEIGGKSALRHAWAHLRQWQGADPAHTPCGILEDEPRFARRGFMLDVSRCKVPTREGLARWVNLLAAFRFNELQLYTEHTFAYSKHPRFWEEASPITPDDIKWLQALCAEKGIELVPNQNCFGHFERWLCHPEYRKYAECPDGFETPWGEWRSVGSVLRPDQASFELVQGLLDELLPNFTANRVNIGCDETFELGQGKSKARCEREGMGSVYADFVARIMRHVIQTHGRRPEFWGDILVKHPDQLHKIPREAIALEWGYEAGHPFETHGKLFADSGLEFAVCPGTSSWQSFGGRTENMLQNIREAVQSGMQNQASGLLLTDWGDRGHLQVPEVSFPALAWAGLCAWNPDSAKTDDAWRWCDLEAFDGEAGATEKWLDLGRVSDVTGNFPNNASAIFKMFRGESLEVSPEKIGEALEFLEGLPCPETGADVWRQTARNLKLGLVRGQRAKVGKLDETELLAEAKAEHRRLWNLENRPGGLQESLGNYDFRSMA